MGFGDVIWRSVTALGCFAALIKSGKSGPSGTSLQSHSNAEQKSSLRLTFNQAKLALAEKRANKFIQEKEIKAIKWNIMLSKHLLFSLNVHCDIMVEAANRNCDYVRQSRGKVKRMGKSAKLQERNTNGEKKLKHSQLKIQKIIFFLLSKRTCTANIQRVNALEVLVMSAYSPIIKDPQKQWICALLQYLQPGKFLNEELSWCDGKVFSSKPVT